MLDTGQLVCRLNELFYRAANRQYLRTIKHILQQQYYLYQHPGSKVKDRIVSLHKPYVRPIKRGKENKPTEFGAKVHMMQVDGLCFIEHLDFNAFNECKRLKISIVKHKIVFEVCHQVSADKIYATNENRRFCTQRGIFTNFVSKGRLLEDQPEVKARRRLKDALNQDRATRLEGSFGNHKNHYGLNKVKARNQANEAVWIYFGVFTANAIQVANQRQHSQMTDSLKQAA